MTLKKQAAKVRKAGYKNSGQDSILAHITPEEAMTLKARGGSGRTDPHTGLPHFDSGESDGVGGFNEGAPSLGGFSDSDLSFNPVSMDDLSIPNFNVDNSLSFNSSDLSFNPVSMDDLSLPNFNTDADSSSFLSSMFGKQGKNAAMAALNALGIPMLGSVVTAMDSNNAQDANAAMGKGFMGSTMGLLGSAFGPIGALAGSVIGNQMGNSFGAIPGMSAADTSAAFAGMSPTANAGDPAPRQIGTGGFGRASSPGTSDFFNSFLTNMVGGTLTDIGRSMFPGSSNQQPQASYPEGEQANSSKLYSLITGQDAPAMSTPWSTMQSQSPNGAGSSAGMFSPTGGEYTQPTSSAQGFSMPTMGQAGNFVGNNLGSLVTGLYGMYNNRRQQGQIRDQMKSLQSLYAPGSPYAQQLQAKIAANAAARGTRSNVAGREVQLQAGLADKAAGMAPSLYQMQQGMGTLQNRELMNLLAMGKDTGLFKSLGSLFQSGE